MTLRSTDQTAEMYQQLLDETWGRDGSVLVAGCMEYDVARHYTIAQGIGVTADSYLFVASGQGAAEHSGDVQQMVQLFEKQLSDMRDYIKNGVPGLEGPIYCCYAPLSFVDPELEALHPFGEGLVALFKAWQCTDPSECEAWYDAEGVAFRARFGEGLSSKDGLHHVHLKATMVSAFRAVLSLALASMGSKHFTLSWLDTLPAADDARLHDCANSAQSFVNARVVIAEVFEGQGRHKEAIRCVVSFCVFDRDAPPSFDACCVVVMQFCCGGNQRAVQL
jgi:hypothetical protein